MYNVSNDYKKIVFQSNRYVDIQMSFDNGLHLDVDELVPHSLVVHKKTSLSNIFSLGGCVVGEARVTTLPGKLSSVPIDVPVEISTGLFVNSNIDIEYVPVGVFTAYDSSYDEYGTTLYMKDNMFKFEKLVSSSFHGIGTPYNLISEICNDCSVTFSDSSSYIQSLPNGASMISLALHEQSGAYTDSYIDVLRDICAYLGGVGVIDRNGNFHITTYGNVTNFSISSNDLLAGTILSYSSEHYTQASSYKTSSEKYISVELSVNDGYNMDLGENRCLQLIDSSIKSKLVPVLNFISVLRFNPFAASAAEGIFLDLCDLISITNYDGSFPCIITEFTYVAGGSYTFKGYGYGLNDSELIDSVVARQLSRIEVEVSSNTQSISNLSLDISDVLRNFADNYNTSSSYSTGDYCVYNNTLYQCTVSTSGTFDPSKWNQVQVVDLQSESSVSYQQYLSSGTSIGKITINGNDTTIYAPNPTSVSYTQTQISGDTLGTITIDGIPSTIYGRPYSTVTFSPYQLSGNVIGTITIDGQSTTLYSPTQQVTSNFKLLEPTTVSTNPIPDGSTNNVMEWVIETEELNTNVALFTTINCLISTTFVNNTYDDATLTITYKIDGATSDTIIQTYGDGNQIITLSYLIHIASIGLHTISVYFGMSGGSLS